MKLKVDNDIRIVGPKKAVLAIKEFIDDTDILDFVQELSSQSFRDYMIYGYNPWDYLEETKLNMKYMEEFK